MEATALSRNDDQEVYVADDEQVGERRSEPVASPLDRIKGRRAELLQDRHVDLAIPGYGGDLVGRFRPVEWEELRKIALRVDQSKDPRRELEGQATTLIKACRGIYIRQDGKLVPIGDDDLAPVRFDKRLAELLDIEEVDTALGVLFSVFANDLAVTTVHNRLAVWMDRSDEEVDEDLLGESEAVPM